MKSFYYWGYISVKINNSNKICGNIIAEKNTVAKRRLFTKKSNKFQRHRQSSQRLKLGKSNLKVLNTFVQNKHSKHPPFSIWNELICL